MWPWEHLAVGYLGYSLLIHLLGRRPPRSWPVVALAVGTQFPDFVDKPLAWTLGVLPAGHSLAHSLFVAVPLSLLAVAAGRAADRATDPDRPDAGTQVGVGFAFGYLAHLPGDVFYPVLVGGEANYDFLLWPLVPAAESEASVGFVEMFRTLLGQYVVELASGEVGAYLAVELGLLASVLALWLYDGTPPLRSVWSWVLPGREVEKPR